MADFQIASRNYVDSKVSTKQDSLTTNQLNAVNSGITATKVSNYDKLVGGEKVNSISLDESKGVITIDYGTN